MGLFQAYCSGILCNILVCLAVWMSFSGRTVMDKILAVLFPVTTFVALGFEHSVANMFLIPAGLALDYGSATSGVSTYGLVHNLIPVMMGNLTGGAVFVGLVYAIIYRRDTIFNRNRKNHL